jgi:hypothetical protein
MLLTAALPRVRPLFQAERKSRVLTILAPYRSLPVSALGRSLYCYIHGVSRESNTGQHVTLMAFRITTLSNHLLSVKTSSSYLRRTNACRSPLPLKKSLE